MPPPGRRADARRNHDLLVRAARQVLDEQGVDAPLDEIARRAGVGNATLYRHFATRRDLVVEVYADEVDALCADGTSRLHDADPAAALFGWLAGFAAHVATRRYLPSSISDNPAGAADNPAGAAGDPATGRATGDRARLFDRWHAAMHDTAAALVDRAREAGSIRPDVTAGDLLAIGHGVGLATADPATARHLLDLVRRGTG
jgi:AcrR family transcriptional regulator